MENNKSDAIAIDEAKNVKAEKGGKLTIDDKVTIKELEEKIQKMVEDRDAKCEAAKEQLIEMLKVTVDKYRTATGTAEALRVLRFVFGEKFGDRFMDLYEDANTLAWQMSDVASSMVKKAEKLGYAEMDKLCEGFYDIEFMLEEGKHDLYNGRKLALEMMRIDLCRNVGGSAEDMVSFIKRVEEEIEATQAKLDELKAKGK